MENTLRHLVITAPYARPPETWGNHVKKTVENIQHSVGTTLISKGRDTMFIPGNKTLH